MFCIHAIIIKVKKDLKLLAERRKKRIMKKRLGMVFMAFAMMLTLTLAVKVQANAESVENKVGNTFYNTGEGNGEAGHQVQYKITKLAKNKELGQCVVVGCKDDASDIIISGVPCNGSTDYNCVGIENGAFRNKKNLKNVKFSESAKSITKIPAECFSGCTKLKKVVIGNDTLSSIGTKAFYNCKKLSKIEFKTKKLNAKSKFGSKSFKNVKNIEVEAPTTKLAKKYATYIIKRGAKKATYDVDED